LAIVINDFEITVEQPQKGEENKSASAEASHAHSSPKPEDIARVERHFRERRKRIQAN